MDGVHNVTTYEYTSDSLPSETRNDAFSVTYTYDRIGRISDITRQSAGGTSGKTYTYVRPYDTDTESSFKWRSTMQIKSERVGNEYYDYFYDANGNLSVIGKKIGSSNDYNYAESYQYDSLNRVSTATYLDFSSNIATAYSYTYDSRGNVTKCKKSTLNLSTSTSTDTDIANFTYNSVWKDLIATYNGTTITYDNSGNPLTYRDGMQMTWTNGKELATLTKGSTSVTYKYDDNSLRTKRTVNGTVHNYEYVNNKLMYEEIGTNKKLYFSYDALGNPFTLNYNGTYYYYDLNWRGDVIALFGTDNTLKARYEYDEWGKLLGIYDANDNLITSSSHIGIINPLRYRGYYYDTESELYYLGSRYYDPKTYRFINADKFVSTGQGLFGTNMYAYCNDNPTNMTDITGNLPNFCTIMSDSGSNHPKAIKYSTPEKIHKTFDSFCNNLSADLGVGFGLQATAKIDSVVDVSAGAKADMAHIKVEGKNIDLGTELYEGVSASIFNIDILEFGDEYFYGLKGDKHNNIYPNEETIIGFGLSGYIVIGGEISISFNVDKFYNTVKKYWR
ncbi:MAG: RHS repeat-associated core domain-containing protein [Clostridiales bacterium]|nr:RHS repeat-associated core domain-containing protein [Clostridiales bacterium]